MIARKQMGRALRAVGEFLLWSAIMGVCCGLAPIYHSDQHTYFVHGLARAGMGCLDKDRLANTTDLLPVFSLVVSGTHRLSDSFFYVYCALLMGVYFRSMVGICASVFPLKDSKVKYFVYIAVVVAIHSSFMWRCRFHLPGSGRAVGGWWLHYGLAGQRVFFRYFQPAAFGVLGLLSLLLFSGGRPFAAIAVLVLCPILHPPYLLTAGLMTLSYMLVEVGEKRTRRALAMGGLAFLLVLPILCYLAVHFRPTSAEVFHRYQKILVDYRLSERCNPGRWLKASTWVRLLWVGLALYWIRKHRLFRALCLMVALVVVLTAVQMLSNSYTLAMLYPWRISVLLVPLATCIIAAGILNGLFRRLGAHAERHARVSTSACVAIILILAVSGLFAFRCDLQQQRQDKSVAMMEFVKRTKKPTDQFLIPVSLQRFRLYTGAATFVDFKAHPYRDCEVVEWYGRLRAAQDFYARLPKDEEAAFKTLEDLSHRYGVTHVVVEGRLTGDRGCFSLLYADADYAVYSLGKK